MTTQMMTIKYSSGSKFKEEGQSRVSSQSHQSERFHRDFGAESLLLKSCSVLPPDERWSIHEGNVNILNAKTDEQLKEDRVTMILRCWKQAVPQFSQTGHQKLTLI